MACCVLAAVILSHVLWPWRWVRRLFTGEPYNGAVAWGLETATVPNSPRAAEAFALLLLAMALTIAGAGELAAASSTNPLCTVAP